MTYQWILFDADETLFAFNSYLGLKAVLANYGIDFSPQDYAEFQAVNQPLWVAYQNQEISAETLRTIRFAKLAEQTGQTAETLNHQLMEAMAERSPPLEGVQEMLQALHGKVKMAIITNGFNALQQKRLTYTDTGNFFEFVLTSEEVGAAKPDRAIFTHAFQKMGVFDSTRVLMVGDTLASDILGGQQAGLDTCWFNPQRKANHSEIRPTFEIHTIRELIAIASGQKP